MGSHKKIPIGTILRKDDEYGFRGEVKDHQGNAVKCEAAMIMREVTVEDFKKEIVEYGINLDDVDPINFETAHYYDISVD